MANQPHPAVTAVNFGNAGFLGIANGENIIVIGGKAGYCVWAEEV